MKVRFCLSAVFMCVVAGVAALIPQAAYANPELFIAQGTPIEVQPVLSLSGMPGGFSKGAQLTFRVKKDVIVDGRLAIAKGALVRGLITTSATKNADGRASTQSQIESPPSPSNSPSSENSNGTAASGALSTAMTMLNKAMFAFEWVQLPAGKVRLDDHPQSFETAMLGIGASAYTALTNILGTIKSDPTASSSDLGMHTTLEAHIARSVHVPALEVISHADSDDSGYIDH